MAQKKLPKVKPAPLGTLSAKELKDVLWSTLDLLRQGAISVSEVTATANISKEITRCTNAQLKISAHTGRALPDEVVQFSENSKKE